MKLKNMKIGNKLLLLIVIPILFIGVVGGTGFIYMNDMAQNTQTMFKDRLIPIKQIQTIQTNQRKIDTYIMEMMITNDTERTKSLIENINNNMDANDQLLSDYEKGRSNYVQERIKKYYEIRNNYKKELQNTIELAVATKNEQAYNNFMNVVKPLRNSMGEITDELTKYNENQANDLNKSSVNNLKVAENIIWTAISLSIVICALLGFAIYRIIVHPIKELQSLMHKAEKGDLSVSSNYKSRDEVGLLSHYFNNMMLGLGTVVNSIKENAELLAASSEEMSASTELTSKATEHIVENIQEVATSAENQFNSVGVMSRNINEVSSGIKQIAASAQEASSASVASSQKAEEGNKAIKIVEDQMQLINDIVVKLSETVNGLGNRSQEIGQITDVITEIATQTNLLALNAAIEAARAGEAGKGFAVVAEEVRKLAEQSALSAKQIEDLIFKIQNETTTIHKSMEVAKREVSTGMKVVTTAGGSFEEIQNSTNEVVSQIHEVSSASQQISTNLENIIKSVELIEETAKNTVAGTQNISSATEEQLATMEEISSTSNQLAVMASELQQLVIKFTTT